MANETPVDDELHMARAIELATRQLGRTSPNPPVGCVLVKDGVVIAEAATGDGGRPHAEEAALAVAGAAANGATAYVTLEPCHSRSSGASGCSDRLISAGVLRVVIATEDHHPTAADGLNKLKVAGIPTEVGCLRDAAQKLVAGFFKVLDAGRPLVGVSADLETYDAEFYLAPGESFEDSLKRMAREGKTRIRVVPGSPLASALRARGLVDIET